jgi:hypothetical protein
VSQLSNIIAQLESGGTGQGQPASMVNPLYGQYGGFTSQYGSGAAGVDNYANQMLAANPNATLGDFYAGYAQGTGNPANPPSLATLQANYPSYYNNLVNNSGVPISTPLASLVGDATSTGSGGDTLTVAPSSADPGLTFTDPNPESPSYNPFTGTAYPGGYQPFLMPGTDIPVQDQSGSGAPVPQAQTATGTTAGTSVIPALGANIGDFFTRAGLVLLAIVLIAAAAWALVRGEDARAGLAAVARVVR